MFSSLKQLIDGRLGKLIVLDDFVSLSGYFLKIESEHLLTAAFFLKNDPDVRLTLLDQIIVVPKGSIPWTMGVKELGLEILYQLKSLKLPYQVSLAVDIPSGPITIPSISSLFLGATWAESDINKSYGIEFETN